MPIIQDDDESEAVDLGPNPTGDIETPRPLDVLAMHALEAALGENADILDDDGVAVVAIVAEPGWMSAVRRALLARNRDLHVWTIADARYSGVTDADVARRLGAGQAAVGIAARLDALPQALVRTADLRLEIRPPTGPALAVAIAQVLGGDPPAVDPAFGAGLGACELAAAIRARGTTEEAVERIARAQRAASGTREGPPPPPLSALAGYGAAMDFCRALVADVAAYRAGRIGWADVRGAAVLASPPGCGKTTLVASLACELGAPLVSTSVAAWFTTYKNGALDDVVRAAAASHASAVSHARATGGVAIWFLDEIDALPDRATLDGRARDWWSPVVTHVLTLLDGALAAPGVVVIAATNHADRLDAALVRPGRLSRIVTIGPATAADVPGILAVHLRGELAGADLSALAPLGAGRTGADLAQAVQEARGAARLAGRPLALEDLARALAPPETVPPEHLRRLCLHEAGHVVVARALGLRVRGVSLSGAGDRVGFAAIEAPGVPMPTLADVETLAMVRLGGRAAEELLLGAPSASAQDDLAQASGALAAAHARWGFGASLRVCAPDDPRIARAVEADLARLYGEALALLARERRALEGVADALGRARVLDAAGIDAAIAAARAPRRRRAP